MARVSLGEVALEARETCKGDKSGYPIVGLEHITPEEIQLKNWDDDSENTFTKRFHKGDVLFGRRRAYLKKAALAPFDGICSGDITVIRAMPDKIVPELLPFIIQNDDLFDFAVGRSAGSLSPRVKWEHLKKYSFELPDMDKQRELANVLWAIEDTRLGYQELLTATEELVKSRFIEMFGDPVRNPMNWEKGVLKDITSKIGSGATPKGGNASYKNEGISLIRSMNVHNGYFDYKGLAHIDGEQASLLDNVNIESNDVLLNITGASVARCCVVPDDILPARVNQHVCILRCKDDILPMFLNAVLISDQYQAKLWNIAEAGATRQALSKEKIETFQIILPPISLQKQFANFVDLIDKSKLVIQETLVKHAALKAAIMRTYFN